MKILFFDEILRGLKKFQNGLKKIKKSLLVKSTLIQLIFQNKYRNKILFDSTLPSEYLQKNRFKVNVHLTQSLFTFAAS